MEALLMLFPLAFIVMGVKLRCWSESIQEGIVNGGFHPLHGWRALRYARSSGAFFMAGMLSGWALVIWWIMQALGRA